MSADATSVHDEKVGYKTGGGHTNNSKIYLKSLFLAVD